MMNIDYKARIEAQIKKRQAEQDLFRKAGNTTGINVMEILIVELRELLKPE